MPKLVHHGRHVDGVSIQIAQHQPGEGLLHRIRDRIELCAQRLFGNMLELERPAADLLESGHDLQRAEGLGSAELDGPAVRGRRSKREGAHRGDIAEGNPTDRVGAGSIDARRSVGVVEPQCGAEPHFHEPARLNNGEVQARDGLFDLAFGIGQRERHARCPAKRKENKPPYVGGLGRVHQVHLSG